MQAPRPPLKWSGVLKAQVPPNECAQSDFLQPIPLGSEDCLYLNVFTPRLPAQVSPQIADMNFNTLLQNYPSCVAEGSYSPNSEDTKKCANRSKSSISH